MRLYQLLFELLHISKEREEDLECEVLVSNEKGELFVPTSIKISEVVAVVGPAERVLPPGSKFYDLRINTEE